MKLGGRRVGNLTIFMDSTCEEVLLKIETDSSGAAAVSFRLYDSQGNLVVDSPDAKSFPEGISIRAADDELLLEIPPLETATISYCLYSKTGKLLTSSDGVRTQIFGGLRMAGKN